MLKKILIPFIFVLIVTSSFSQVVTNFSSKENINENGKFIQLYKINNVDIPTPDLTSAYEKEKEQLLIGSKIFFFAHPISVKLAIPSKINWISNGENSYGRFKLISKGAKSLSIDFENFYLPKGTEMYVYNANGEMITGVITDKENNKNKFWGSSIYKGEEINIEIKTPVKTKESLTLDLINVAYGYKNIFVSKVGGFGASGPCNINVLCPLGNNWVGERNSVVHILISNGVGFASGSLVMNTCGTNIPYILTANHVYAVDQDVSKWKFFFQAWSSTCTPNTDISGLMFNGSTLRANWDQSDFCLVQLNQTPAASPLISASVLITYSGWSRSTVAPNGVVGIHHPSGDVMKISASSLPVYRSDNTTWPASGSVTIVPPGVFHWLVRWPATSNGTPTSGVTEGGSSGSPLYDQNHRIVGQLGGGPSDCSNTSIKQDVYGRFDNSWIGGGTPSTRLSDWLDPTNTGALTTDLTAITSLNAFNSSLSLTINGDAQFCNTSNNYSVGGLPAGFSILWTASPSGVVAVNSPNALQTTLTKITDGNVTLTATVTNCQGTLVVTKPVYTGIPSVNGVSTTYNILKCIVRGYKFTLPNTGATNFKWFSRNITQQTPFVQFKNGAQNWATQGGDGSCDQTEIKVEATNACNTSSPVVYTFPSDLCPPFTDGSCSYRAITASPNPISSNVEIAIFDELDVKEKNIQPLKIEVIRIINKEGQIKKIIKGNNLEKMKIDISDLPADVYTILVFDGKVWISKQIIKN